MVRNQKIFETPWGMVLESGKKMTVRSAMPWGYHCHQLSLHAWCTKFNTTRKISRLRASLEEALKKWQIWGLSLLPPMVFLLYYRGFDRVKAFTRKGGCVHILTFRITARVQSKSNRCIWHTTLLIWLLIRPGSFNWNKFLFWLLLNSFR